jgi:aspartyl-tRNA(Asn)/glutamyl-tRNA(Gln) amidotransferase subunit A
VDALVLPTVPFVAPAIEALRDDAAFIRTNLLALRTPSVFNFYDLPALSLPIARPAGALPAGLMVVGRRGRDRDLLAIGAALQGLPALAA